MEAISTLALVLGTAWASGINLYATVLVLGGLGAAGVIDLPQALGTLETAPVLITAAVLYGLEFFADKIPGVDSLNDALHTFIRVPAGALLAAGMVGDVAPTWQTVAALLLGGAVALGSHATKAGGRAAVNMSPEPFSNIALSFIEDMAVVGALTLAVFAPIAFLVAFACFVAFAVWLLPRIARGLRRLWRKLRGGEAKPSDLRGGTGSGGPEPDPDPPALHR